MWGDQQYTVIVHTSTPSTEKATLRVHQIGFQAADRPDNTKACAKRNSCTIFFCTIWGSTLRQLQQCVPLRTFATGNLPLKGNHTSNSFVNTGEQKLCKWACNKPWPTYHSTSKTAACSLKGQGCRQV